MDWFKNSPAKHDLLVSTKHVDAVTIASIYLLMDKHAEKAKAEKKGAAKKKAATIPAAKKTMAKKTAAKSFSTEKSRKDPKGGLTQAGREYFKKTEGAHLKPGVSGKADTPEKQKRKGSFLRRHFANPRGPMEKDGEPTRLALSAHAWGEPVPKDNKAAKKLATKGTALLKKYKAGKTNKA